MLAALIFISIVHFGICELTEGFESVAPGVGDNEIPATAKECVVSTKNLLSHNSCNETVGVGVLGFGNLGYQNGLRRWILANRAPDIGLVDLVGDGLPVFLVFMAAEELVARWEGKRVYYYRQTLQNLAAMAIMFGLLGR